MTLHLVLTVYRMIIEHVMYWCAELLNGRSYNAKTSSEIFNKNIASVVLRLIVIMPVE